MNPKTLLAALLLASASLAALPSASALQSPPQCMSIDSCCGIEPAFAPCCFVLECPPPVARCPPQHFASTDYILMAIPQVTVDVYSDCSVQVCVQPTCCVVDGRDSRCSAISASTSAAAGPCPYEHNDGVLRVSVSAECHVLIEYKPYDCVWNCGWHTYLQGPPVTLRVYQQNSPSESSSAAELPDPCGETANCQPPSCTPKELASSEGLPFTLTARVNDNCWLLVSMSDPQCPGPTAQGGNLHTDGIVSLWVDTCRLDLTCTCDPLPIAMAAALPDLFPECPGMGSCCGIEPEGGGCGPSPSAPSCPEESVSTTDLFAYMGPHATVAVHSDCTVDVSEHGLVCATLVAPDPGAVDRTVGPVQVHADTCVPDLDCTCPPLMAPASSAAQLQPPVEVEWVVCVTDPCPSPRITCHIAPRAVPGFTVTVSQSCHVTIEQEPLPCEAPYSESATYGPVTVKRWYCGPGYPE